MSNPITQRQPKSESDLQAIVAEILRSNGWTAVREYHPDNANRRIDIFAEHDTYGTLGIETKHIRRSRDAAVLAEAYLQITRDYWNRNFNGQNILFWAIAPYFQPGKVGGSINDGRISDFVRDFITETGVGFMNCHADTLKVMFDADDLSKTIPIAGPYSDHYDNRLDLAELREYVTNRRQERCD